MWAVLAGFGLGAALMYALDPQAGARRRALVRDKMVRSANKTGAAAGATARDLRNRTLGLAAEVRSRLGSREASDAVVAERVRAELGRVVSHPGSIHVSAQQGRVTLSGPILSQEVDPLLAVVAAVPGVTAVMSRLQARERAGDIPGLQGGVRREPRSELRQTHWSPTARLLAGVTGGALVALAGARRSALGAVGGLAGLGLLARGLTDLEFKRLFGIGAGRRAIDIAKTLTIAAPVEEVYAFWSDYRSFPRFMSNVRDVQDRGDGRSRWTVAGPAGIPIEWDAEITRQVPNELLAWKTVPGSPVEHAGVVRFQPNRDGSTRVHVRMSYNPPAGAVGHAVATLFGADPKSEMDADLVRMKTLIETGTPPHDAAQPSRGAGLR